MGTASRRLCVAGGCLALALIAGTIGYHLIEGWSAFDALYMTVITLATVGYGELHPLSAAGRVFTIWLIIIGVGILTYGVTAATAFVVEGTLTDMIRRRRMEQTIHQLTDHIVLCGLGETGRHVAEECLKTHVPFVAIEQDGERIRYLQKIGPFLSIEGDATDEGVLERARIRQARGLVSAFAQDRDNVFVVLTARALNPNLRIVARVVEVESQAKLMKAGADATVSVNAIGGLRMASELIRPAVVSFLDQMLRASGETVRVESVKIPAGSKLIGGRLGEAKSYEKTGLLVIAIARGASYELNPDPQTQLREADELIACGSREQLQRLADLVAA